jgi:hypothetical protein
MPDCRLTDPSVLAAWLDRRLEPDRIREIDHHLEDGCPVCWSVIRFVEQLRELVGKPSDEPDRASRQALSVLLDSDALRRVIGLPDSGAWSREVHVAAGDVEARLRVESPGAGATRRIEMLALDRRTMAAPAFPVRLEVRRGEAVLAHAETDSSGRLALPLAGPGPHRIRLRSPGAPPATLAL